MNYRVPRHRIREIVEAPKCLTDAAPLDFVTHGAHGRIFDASVDLVDGPFCDLRFSGTAGRLDLPTSYRVNFLIEARRVRGIDHCAVPRQRFRSKERIPEGWHQNICDPNMPTDHPEWNRHEALSDFSPTDFEHLIHMAADLWRIDLGWEKRLL